MASVRRVLILDREARARGYSGAWLRGYRVLRCESGEEAMALLEQHPDTEVLLADERLADARFLAHCARQHPHTVRVVITRAPNARTVPERVSAGEVFRFVARPVKRGDLLQTLAQACARHDLLRERGIAGAPAAPSGDSSFEEEMVTIAAHDIRSPLSVILGYARILQEEDGGLTERTRHMLRRIQNTVTRLLALVDNILDLSVIELGRQVLDPTPVRLPEIVEDARENLAGLLEEKDLTCVVECPDTGSTFLLDRSKALQVLQNVLSNAIKFSEPGSTIRVACQGTPERVTFAVTDTGPGLTPEQADRVFEKFSRFAAAPQQGTGLGLAIAKALTELHGGEIRVVSVPGGGSTFTFTLTPQREQD